MRKFLLIVVFSLVCIACDTQENDDHTIEEFEDAFNVYEIPIGTYFWNEFKDFESQYGLTEDESKLLGDWLHANFSTGPSNNSYAFFPNKLFLLKFKFENFRTNDAEKMYFNKALGTWEIIDNIVYITIYAIITEDDTLDYRSNKGVFFVERPYTIDFINIDDIDERGFTRRSINDAILSRELQQKVTIKEPNKTNNLYVRNVYSIDVITDSGKPEKNYGYFSIVPEMARENLSGLEVATNPELIEKYIFGLWP